MESDVHAKYQIVNLVYAVRVLYSEGVISVATDDTKNGKQKRRKKRNEVW